MWEKKKKKCLEKLNISVFWLYYHFPGVRRKSRKNSVVQYEQLLLIKAVAMGLQMHFNSAVITCYHVNEVQWGWRANQRQGEKLRKTHAWWQTAEAGVQWALEWHNCYFQSYLASNVVFMTKQYLREWQWTVSGFCPLCMAKLLLLLISCLLLIKFGWCESVCMTIQGILKCKLYHRIIQHYVHCCRVTAVTELAVNH